MELEIENIDVIIYSLIIVLIIFLIPRKFKKYKKGVIVANAKYVKNTKLYKSLLLKHRIYKVLITIFIIIVIMSSAILLAKTKNMYKEKKELKNNVLIYIEDFYELFYEEPLCYSYLTLYDQFRDNFRINVEKFNKVKSIFNKLDDENISIVYRNNASMCEECTGYMTLHDVGDTIYSGYSENNVKVNVRVNVNDNLVKLRPWEMHLPIVLSSFTDNKKYTNIILDSIIKYNENDYSFWKELDVSNACDRLIRLSGARPLDYAKYTLEHFNYITSYLPYWGNILTFPQVVKGLPSGYGRYIWIYGKLQQEKKYLEKYVNNEEFSNKLSYLEFINDRFEKYSNNSEGNKYIIWYSDINSKLNESTDDILNRVKDYCNENEITVLSVDKMPEDEIVKTIKSSEKIYQIETKKVDLFNTFSILILVSYVIIFILDWRIKI